MMMSRFALCLSAGLVLAACGGGGGGGDSAAPTLTSVPFTTANYDPTGRATAAVLIDVQSSTSIDGLTSADAGSPVAQSTGVFALGRLAMDVASGAIAGRAQPAASSTSTHQCAYGGNFTVTGNDNNNNNQADAGDTASATFNACVDEQGAPAISGGMDLNIKAASSSVLTLGVTFRSLSSGGSTLTGSADLSLGTSASSVKYVNTTSVRNGKSTVYNFTVNVSHPSSPATVAIAGEIGVSGASYTLSTPVAITMGLVYPNGGTLRIADSAGGRVDVVMRATNFDLNLYLPGDDTRDAQATYTWAQLASGAI